MMMTTFLSDLHLGDGGLLEDFLLWGDHPDGPPPTHRPRAVAQLGAIFSEFLSHQRREAETLGFAPHLVLVGDTFDLWQARRHRESDADALARILATHPLVLKALRDWQADGGILTILAGNHDQALVDPRAWAVLEGELPGLNPHSNGAPAHSWSDESAGIYAEHGNQWDPFNRFRSLNNPRATCVGYRVTRAVVNNLEPIFPLIDKGLSMEDLPWNLRHVVESEFAPGWRELAGQLGRLVGREPGPPRILTEELDQVVQGRKESPDLGGVANSRRRLYDRSIRRILRGKKGKGVGSPPKRLRFLVSGHTHFEGWWRRLVGENFIELVDCGTWTPRVVRSIEGKRTMLQRLPYVVILPDPVVGHRAWVGELRK